MQSIGSLLTGRPDRLPVDGLDGRTRREREEQARREEMAALAQMTADEAAQHLNRRCPYCGALLTPYELYRCRFGATWRYHDRHGCQAEEQALAAREAAWQQAEARRFQERLTRAGLVGGLATAAFDTYHERQDWPGALDAKRRVMAWLDSVMAGERKWLLLHGGYGMGKTHLAAACVRRVLEERDRSAFLRVWPQYLQRLKLSWSTRDDPEAEKEYDIVNELSRGWLVVLDDLDKVAATDWQRQQLFTVVNQRMLDRLPTIITCNTTPGVELARIVGKATMDRILGCSVVVALQGGPSYRSGLSL